MLLRLMAIGLSFVFTLSVSHAQQQSNAQTGQTQLNVEVITDDLDRPWGLAFLPDGSQLVTERGGALRHIVGGRVSRPIGGLPASLQAVGQGGLLDILVDPDFNTNQRIFFSFTEQGRRGRYSTAVASARLSVDQGQLTDVRVIFSANNKSTGGKHFGSRLVMGRDGTIFVTLGDRGTQMRAQDASDHAGSVVRINPDGSIPRNNPRIRGAAREIWSLGHRNAQGATLHRGALWTIEHGAKGGDELNRPRAGRNYGWPLISYGTNYNDTGFAQGSEAPGLEQPIYFGIRPLRPQVWPVLDHRAV